MIELRRHDTVWINPDPTVRSASTALEKQPIPEINDAPVSSAQGSLVQVPGPSRSVLHPFGDIQYMDNIHRSMSELVSAHGPLCKIEILRRPVYICREPRYITQVLAQRNKRLPDTRIAGGHNGIFFADGDKHRDIRTAVQPCFFPERLETLISRIEQEANHMVSVIAAKHFEGQGFVEMFAECERLYFDTMCGVGFSVPSAWKQSGTKPRILELFEDIYHAEGVRQFRPAFMNALPTALNLNFERDVKEMFLLVDAIVKRTRSGDDSAGSRSEDFLETMLKARHPCTGQPMHSESSTGMPFVHSQILNLLRAGARRWHRSSAIRVADSCVLFQVQTQQPRALRGVCTASRRTRALRACSWPNWMKCSAQTPRVP